MLSQEHFIGYVTTTSNNTFTNNFETNGAPYTGKAWQQPKFRKKQYLSKLGKRPNTYRQQYHFQAEVYRYWKPSSGRSQENEMF